MVETVELYTEEKLKRQVERLKVENKKLYDIISDKDETIADKDDTIQRLTDKLSEMEEAMRDL